MKIAIDISQIIYDTGVSTYTKELVKNLLKIDNKNEYLLFGGSLRRLDELNSFTESLKGNFKTKFFPLPPSAADFLWNRIHFGNIENVIGKIDVIHFSDWAQPPTNAYSVTTIHDMSPILLPEETHPKIVAVHRRKLKWVIKEIDKVIVPSQSGKDDLHKLGVASEKIVVTPEACADRFEPASENVIEKLKKKYGISGKYLIAVGNAPRKNIRRTIEAFQMAQPKIGIDNLVIIGRGDDPYLHSDRVIFTGHVPENEMPVFYSGAEALVYASLYEGFGLPILEAFACKCPVVVSDVSSLPEVAANAAVMVKPLSARSIADGIVEVLKDRTEWVKKGNRRLKDFSWEKTAQQTLEIYENRN